MKMNRALKIALLACATMAASILPARASDESGWGDIETLADEEMDNLRGGFEIPGAGISLNLGAVVTTMMNGQPVLTTNITWTDGGAVVEQAIADVGQSLAELTPEQRSELGLDGLTNGDGLVISDEAGVTALVHNVTEGALQNIIVNSATGRDISQNVDVTLTLPGFEAIQRSLIRDYFGIHIAHDMATSPH